MRAWILSLLFVGVALAGCASDSSEPTDTTGEEVVDREGFQFAGGTGAIAGLLVDDRFRPIDLEEGEAAGEFQAAGFILVQETGQQLRTNENGEFNVLDLEPGTYTIRVSAEGHEAIPQKVSVTAGEFAEINVVARRVSTEANTILTESYSVFIPCAFVVPFAGLVTLNCVADLSGDSFRSSVDLNYAETYGDEITFLVAEVLMSQEGNWLLTLRDDGLAETQSWGEDAYAGVYGKVILKRGEAYNEGFDVWENDINLNVGTFYRGDVDAGVTTAGATVGAQGEYIISIFLGEPEVNIEEYCVLC